MATGFYDTSILANHNHTSTPGDGGTLSNLSVLGTLSAAGNITTGADFIVTNTGTNGLKGTITNDSAVAGKVGELKSVSFNNDAVAATDVYKDAATLDLTAGDWDISYFGVAGSSAANAVNIWNLGIGTTPGNNAPTLVTQGARTATAGTIFSLPFSMSARVSISGTVTYIAKTYAQYTGTAPQFQGTLLARRVR